MRTATTTPLHLVCVVALLMAPVSWLGAAAGSEHEITADQASRIQYSTQRFVYLDRGESSTFELRDGSRRRIRLLSVDEEKDPVLGLVRRAQVQLEIDEKPIILTCAPYVMPTEIAGLRVQVDTTSAWLAIPKRVQLSLWDAADPVVDTSLFTFPLPGYRLFSQGMQAYNEPVHLGDRDGVPVGQRFHHNYGVDFAGYEGRQKVVSCISGVVVQADPGAGDLAIKDDRGLIFHFGHLDSILADIRAGSRVERGQWVAMLGRHGASGNFSHLHVGVFLSESDLAADRPSRNLNLYPWLVAAYLSGHRGGPLAVAGPHHTAFTGDTLRFDGRNSLVSQSDLVSFRWKFHDGTTVNRPTAEKTYNQPGCYAAALLVTDSRGATDVNFCTVRVFSRGAPEEVIPTLFVAYNPSAEVRVNEPVNFRIWPQGMRVDLIQIEFGDGTTVREYRPYSALTHRFTTPGIHVVKVTGQAGKLPVTQNVKVLCVPN